MKKVYINLIIFFIISIIVIGYHRNLISEKESSMIIYKKILEYEKRENLDQVFDFTEIEKNSKEYYFFKGVQEYYDKNIGLAYELFKQVEAMPDSDDLIFKIYLNLYINKCEFNLNGIGDIKRSKYIIENINKISFFKNEILFIWNIFSPVVLDETSREQVITLTENYLKDNKDLKNITKIKLKGFIGTFKMMNKNYVESIHIFYDVILKANEIRDSEERNKIIIKAYESIGNMNFILENYEEAIEEYDMSLSIPLKSAKEDANIKYGASINRTMSYIELKDYEGAKSSLEKTKKIIPLLAKDISEGVKVFYYNNYATIEIYENNLELAHKYLNYCRYLLKTNKNQGFFNGDMYIDLTYAKLYIKEKKYQEALDMLNILLEKENKNELGFKEEIYDLQLSVYKELKEFEKYYDIHEKYRLLREGKYLMLRKNYLKFLKSSFNGKKLEREQEKNFNKIKLLIFMFCSVLITVIYQVLKITKLKKNNMIDQLTGIYNRKYLEKLYGELNSKIQKEIGILMIDIDYFKKYNDTYGHIKGDIIIKEIASILRTSIKKDDVAIRYGGEEFLIILNSVSENYLNEIYNKIFNKLEEKNLSHKASLVSDHVTLSIGGVKGIINDKTSFLTLVKKADLALYEAKEEGRNRFVEK